MILKDDLQTKLDLSSSSRTCNLAEVGAAYACSRLIQWRTVESVIELRPELNIKFLRSEVLAKRKIEVVRSWPAEIVPRRISPGSGRRNYEGCRVQIHRLIRTVLNQRISARDVRTGCCARPSGVTSRA